MARKSQLLEIDAAEKECADDQHRVVRRRHDQARLLGFEEEWRELGTKNDLTFTNLAPGNYRLEVQGSNDDGLFGEEGLELEVAVAAPPGTICTC